MFKKVGSRKILSHRVQEQIERAIQDRELSPGDRLPTELELCEKFGVSRTVMREALYGLSAKGFLTKTKGRGMFIKELTASFVVDPMRFYLNLNCPSVGALDVINARQAIEPSIAAMAALNCSPEMLCLLKQNLQEMIQHKGDFAGFAELDSNFHHLVAKASTNPIMPLVIEPVRKLMPQISLALYDVVEDAIAIAVDFHTRILAAIEAKDAEAARQCMYDHLKKAEQHIRLTLDQKSRG